MQKGVENGRFIGQVPGHIVKSAWIAEMFKRLPQPPTVDDRGFVRPPKHVSQVRR